MPTKILLLDDNAAHRLIARRALSRAFAYVTVIEAETVHEAKDASPATLSLALVDLRLGIDSGLSWIKEARRETTLYTLPIVVLSTSELLLDIAQSYAAGVNCYLFKSNDPVEFQATLIKAVRYFLSAT